MELKGREKFNKQINTIKRVVKDAFGVINPSKGIYFRREYT